LVAHVPRQHEPDCFECLPAQLIPHTHFLSYINSGATCHVLSCTRMTGFSGCFPRVYAENEMCRQCHSYTCICMTPYDTDDTFEFPDSDAENRPLKLSFRHMTVHDRLRRFPV